MQIHGKLVIVFIFGTALAAAVFAWTFQYLRGKRVLELWGPRAARLIRVEGDTVWLLVLEEAPDGDTHPDTAKTMSIADDTLRVAERIDISQARGLIHARQALIEDASFAWEQPRGNCAARWQYALQFRHGDDCATVAIDTNCGRARLLETGAEASIAPIAAGMETFLEEQRPEGLEAL